MSSAGEDAPRGNSQTKSEIRLAYKKKEIALEPTSSGLTVSPMSVRPFKCFPGPIRIACIFNSLSCSSIQAEATKCHTYAILSKTIWLGRLPSSSRA